MSGGTVYSIDTSSIITARNKVYPPDAFPGLWLKIEELIANNRLCAAEEVKHELNKRSDEASKWSKAQMNLYVPLDAAQANEVTRILSDFSTLVDPTTGNSAGDPFIIALAKLRNHVLITEEKWTNSPKRTKIPNVCKHYGIPCITVLELIRREKWSFN